MELKDLIKKYQAIKPSQAWVERNRTKILASYREAFPIQHRDLFFYFKPVFATILALFMFVTASSGVVVYAQKTSPGNQLYALKRAYETVVMVLTPASQKKVFRAEIITRRLDEVQYLSGIEKESVSSLSLQVATRELEKEIATLKKELNGEEEITIAQESDLPVRDNQKIIEAVNNRDIDLAKILSETKEAIKSKNFETAVVKLGDLERIFSVTVDENNQSELTKETLISNIQQTINNTSTIPEINLETPTMPAPAPVIKKIIPDFKVDMEVEKETESSQK